LIKHDLENIIFQKMNNLEATPPEFVWGNVEKEISVSKNNKKPFFYYSTAAVLLLLMAALTFYFLNSREQIESNLNHEEGNSSSVSVQDSIALEVNNKAAKDSLYIKENIPSDVSTLITSQKVIKKSKIIIQVRQLLILLHPLLTVRRLKMSRKILLI